MAFATQRSLVGAMVFIGLTSFAVMVFLEMANTLMQTRTPDHLRGRAMSVLTSGLHGLHAARPDAAWIARYGRAGIDTAFLAGPMDITVQLFGPRTSAE
jgi:hypothetical protein